MKKRPIGQSGIDASTIGLGTWAIGGWMWGGTDEDDAIKAIHAAIDSGVDLIDTAPIYGFGVSEEIVGRAIADRRDKVVLATKCGLVWDREQGVHYFNSDGAHPTPDGDISVYKCLDPASIRTEVERSLKRLQTDVIDLYQTHWQESTTPIEDSMDMLMRLKKEGKIRAIGCSNANVEQMRQYVAAGDLAADQELFSMLDWQQADENLDYCAEHNVAFLAYSPLAQGLLTGKIGPDRTFGEGDQRSRKNRFSVENRERVAAMLKEFTPFADDHGISMTQLVLAWTLEQRGCSHVLVGARDEAQARENAQAGSVELSEDDVKRMDQIARRHVSEIV